MKLVIFDMDGVLVDGCEWHRIALNNALLEVCNYEIPLDEHYKIYNGLPTKVKLQKLSEKGVISPSQINFIENLKQEKTELTILECAVHRKEKIELLEYLKGKGVKVACFTNCIRHNAELMLRLTGVLELFDLLVTNQDVTRPKPDPEGYLMCMKSLGIEKADCLIIEDSPKGVQAAQASGANVLVVEGPDEVTVDLIRSIIP
jgi:HAD superfamily hydrolase (TIGR01509 family)